MIEKLPADVARGECSAKSLNITSFVEDKNKAEVLWQVVSTFLILETMGGDRSHVKTCDVHYSTPTKRAIVQKITPDIFVMKGRL